MTTEHLTVEVDYDLNPGEDRAHIINNIADDLIGYEGMTRVKVYGRLAGRTDLLGERFSEDAADEPTRVTTAPGVYVFTLADGDTLHVNVTQEGIILDAFDGGGEHVGTSATMADDLWESCR